MNIIQELMGGIFLWFYPSADVAKMHFVPSSVGLLGKHTDHVSGHSLSWDMVIC